MGGECGSEENSLLALRTVSEHNETSDEASRRRKPPVHCRNPDGTKFNCAGGDRCCGGACVGQGDICCENANGDNFPCQGKGGNAAATHALHLAASVASRRVRRVDGTPSARAPSAELNR